MTSVRHGRHRRRSDWRRPPRLAGALTLVAMTSLFGLDAGQGVADEPLPTSNSAFYALGNADGVRVSILVPGYAAVEQIADSGMPSAQALTTSTDGQGFAGAPYPGSDFYFVLGTASANSGQDLNEFPLTVRSNSGTPKAERNAGAVSLKATTEETTSTASATSSGGNESGAVGSADASASSKHETDGTAIAKSFSKAEAIGIGDVLRIGAVEAKAEVTAPQGGAVKRASALEVSEVRVVGQAVGFTEKGLTVAGTSQPLPADSPLTAALKDQGIKVTYIAAEETKDGIISAGLRVDHYREYPNLPEPVTVTYLFGRASAFAQGGEAETPLDSGPVVSDVPPAAPAAEPAAPEPQTGGASIGSGSNEAPAVEQPSVAEPQAQPATTNNNTRAVASRGALTTDPAYFYLVLVVGGVLLVGGVQLLRLFGVKAIWA